MTLNELAERVPVAMMTTINKQNQLVSRPMLVVCAEHGVMWFLTRADSDKSQMLEVVTTRISSSCE